MTSAPLGQGSDAQATTASSGRGRFALGIIVAVAFVLAAVVGAYLDWRWWVVAYGGGLLLALGAGVTMAIGGILALIGRGLVRRVALVVLAVGIGLLAGQVLGPSREELIYQGGGTMTLRLTSPVVATATGSVDCENVASSTEFQVSGEPNMRLETPDSPFVSVYLNVGDRWEVLRDVPRKDGVRLDIGITGALVSDAGKPSTVGMQAAPSSSLESTFSNAGGSVRFAHLVAQSGPDFNGESLDLAGTIEWTCGAAVP